MGIALQGQRMVIALGVQDFVDRKASQTVESNNSWLMLSYNILRGCRWLMVLYTFVCALGSLYSVVLMDVCRMFVCCKWPCWVLRSTWTFKTASQDTTYVGFKKGYTGTWIASNCHVIFEINQPMRFCPGPSIVCFGKTLYSECLLQVWSWVHALTSILSLMCRAPLLRPFRSMSQWGLSKDQFGRDSKPS